ncbi:MAG TPA: ferrous iron transporter B [Candidatus Limnocylindrales bacterium]|nr:ferrous iron transporter B [Candidatus Limnocylindrales bacterium]
MTVATACHVPGAVVVAASDRRPVIALVGRPNVGKSTFVAKASRRFVETANAPGTTVSLERVPVTVDGTECWLVDLPGTRSLDDTPAGDGPFWELLLQAAPDAILVVVDAGNLARHLPLAIAVRDLGLPIVVATNLTDEAGKRGIDIDAGRLGQLLNAPIHATCGRTGAGVDGALRDAVRLASQRRAVAAGEASPRGSVPAPIYPYSLQARLSDMASSMTLEPRSLGAAAVPDALHAGVLGGRISARGGASIRLSRELEPVRWQTAADWARQAERRRDVREPFADRLARWSTAPWPGIPMFLGVSIAAFLAVIYVGGFLAAVLGEVWGAVVSPFLTTVVPALVPIPIVANGLLWAVDGGLLGMLSVGIPYVLTFYLLLAMLEDSGYLTSAAVLMDRVFGAFGLPGRTAIPLLAAAGCNVPAVYGTRVLRTKRERVIGSFLITLTPCSARSAVVIAAVAPFAGVGAAIAAFGVVALATIGAGVAANALIPGRQPQLVLELAPLRAPIPRFVATKAWWRFRSFVVTATPIMLVGSLVLGLIYEAGVWQGIADLTGPSVEWLLGLPAIAGVAIAFAFLRKELALQLLIAFAAVELGYQAGLGELMTPSQLFVFAVVSSLSIPCIATLSALRGELGTRAAVGISVGTVALALGVGAVLARLLGIA